MQTIGKKGELLAVAYLEEKGYKVLETNYRFRKSEIDIIACSGEVLVFAEVKTRSGHDYGMPETFVSKEQENSIIRGAEAYIHELDWQKDIRFDVIAILRNTDKYEINHFEDAFH